MESFSRAYEDFNGYKFGQYVNGAISPFTAGELAKAAFNNGYEEYGWDIITRFMKLVERDGTTYFLYYPDSKPQAESGPSTWGAAALLSAIDEGLAGICDKGVNYDNIYFSPKFPVTHYTELRYITGYEVSGTLVDVRFILKEEGMRYDIYSPAKKIQTHILMPKGKTCAKVLVDRQEHIYSESIIGDSVYIDFSIEAEARSSIEIMFVV